MPEVAQRRLRLVVRSQRLTPDAFESVSRQPVARDLESGAQPPCNLDPLLGRDHLFRFVGGELIYRQRGGHRRHEYLL